MKKIQCRSCGSSEIRVEGLEYICIYCRSRFSVSEEKVSDSNEGISINNDIVDLLRKCEEEPTAAGRYANLILDIDPTNQEALRYLK
jgi:hypothetical protein